MAGGSGDFAQVILHQFPVVQMGGRQIGKADDGVHGSADIVRHIVKKHGFGPGGPLGLDQRFLQQIVLLLEFFVRLLALCNIHKHPHIGDRRAVFSPGKLAGSPEPAVAPVLGQKAVFHIVKPSACVIVDGGIIFLHHPVVIFRMEQIRPRGKDVWEILLILIADHRAKILAPEDAGHLPLPVKFHGPHTRAQDLVHQL